MIVFVHLLNDFSGSPRVLRDVIEISVKNDRVVLFHGSRGRGVLTGLNVPIVNFFYNRSRFKIVTLINYLVSQFSLFIRLSRCNLISKDAIIYVNTLLPFAAIIWAKANGHRVIVHAHEISISPKILRLFLSYVARTCADKILYVSNDHRLRLDISHSNDSIVPNTISEEMALSASKATYQPRRSGYFDILMLSSFKDYKGINEYISLVDCFSKIETIRFTLVLSGPERDIDIFKLKNSKFNNLRIFTNVKDPSIFYEECDVLLNLSKPTQWVETFGLTILEAMSFGVPVIVPTVGGPTELVTDGCEGFLVDSRDFECLKDRIMKIFSSPSLAMHLSKLALSRSKDFDRKVFEKRFRSIISELKG